MQAYPFIARKLLTGKSTTVQTALQEVLYDDGDGTGGSSGLKLSRLIALLNNAAGSVSQKEGAVFVDIDRIPDDGISFREGLKFMMSDDAESLRNLLEPEVDSIVDVLTRQIFRKGIQEAFVALTPPRPLSIPFLGDILPPGPNIDKIPLPLLLPGRDESSIPTVVITSFKKLTDAVAPKLNQDEEIFALGLADAAQEFFGDDMGDFVRGESVFSTKSAELLLSGLRSGFVGGNEVLSHDTVQSVVDASADILALSQQSPSSSTSSLETELKDAIKNLDPSERQRLDQITNELTKRYINKFLNRLENIENN